MDQHFASGFLSDYESGYECATCWHSDAHVDPPQAPQPGDNHTASQTGRAAQGTGGSASLDDLLLAEGMSDVEEYVMSSAYEAAPSRLADQFYEEWTSQEQAAAAGNGG